VSVRLARASATVGLLLAVFVVALDGTIMATALPRIAAELGALQYYVWVTTGYLVTSTVVQPIAGKLGDLVGRRSVVVTGLVGFMIASVLAGLSQTTAELVVLRAIQGLFGGVLFAVPFAAVADLYAIENRVRVQGLFAAAGGLAAITGPILGGWITDELGWRWIFYLNVPVGILGLCLVLPFLQESEHRGRWRDLDLVGSGTLVAGVAPLLVGLSLGGGSGWTPAPIAMLVAGALLLVVFFVFERGAGSPVVPPSLFTDRVFAIAIVIAAFSGVGLYGVTFFLALLYQAVLSTTATGSGASLVPMMLALAVAAPLSGQLLVRMRHYRFVATAGLFAMAISCALLARANPATPVINVTAEVVLLGAGMGLTWPISTAVIQAAMPMNIMGVATSQVTFWRSLGGTAGEVAMGAIFAQRMPAAVGERISALHLQPEVVATFMRGGSGQDVGTVLDPVRLGSLRADLPASLQPQFDQAVVAIRLAFASALGDLFLLTALLLAVPIVASLLLPEVPLRGRSALAASPSA